jgi:hypothetical protein
MLAAKNDHPKVVKFLLDKGADIKLLDMVSHDMRDLTCVCQYLEQSFITS